MACLSAGDASCLVVADERVARSAPAAALVFDSYSSSLARFAPVGADR